MNPMRPGGVNDDQPRWRLGIIVLITDDHQDEYSNEAEEYNHAADPGIAFEARYGFSTRPDDVDLKWMKHHTGVQRTSVTFSERKK